MLWNIKNLFFFRNFWVEFYRFDFSVLEHFISYLLNGVKQFLPCYISITLVNNTPFNSQL